jgi:hypothetical protein
MFLAAALVSVLYQGFYFGVNNNAVQVPLLQNAADPSLYSGDPYIATLIDYVSGFWKSLSAMHLHVQWAPIFLAFQILGRYLVIVAFDSILLFFVKSRAFSAAGAMLLSVSAALSGYSPVAGHTMLANYFEHTQLANALLLFSCAAWMRCRELWAAVLLGIAFDINAFVSAWGVAALLLAAMARKDMQKPGILKRTIVAAVAYILSATPGLIWILAAMHRDAAVHSPQFDYLAFIRLFAPFHFFIGYADFLHHATFALTVACGAIAIATGWPRAREMAYLGLGFFVVFVVGIFLPAITASPLLLNLQLLRVEGIIQFLAALAVVSASFAFASHQKTSGISQVAGATAIGGLLQGDWLVVFMAMSILFAASAFGSATAHKRGLTVLAIVILAIAVVSMVVLKVRPISTDPGHPGGKGIMLALVLLAFLIPGAGAGEFSVLIAHPALQPWMKAVLCLALLPHLFSGSRLRWGRLAGDLLAAVATCMAMASAPYTVNRMVLAASVAALLWSGWHCVYARTERGPARSIASPRIAWAVAAVIPVALILLLAAKRAAAGALTDIPLRRDDPWRDVQEWAKQNTPPHTVFLVPLRGDDGFEVFSERSAWVDQKRSTAVMFSPPYYWIYMTRREEQMQATDARAFAAAYNVCYAIIQRDHPARTLPGVHWPDSSFPVDHSNSKYSVLDLCHSENSQ